VKCVVARQKRAKSIKVTCKVRLATAASAKLHWRLVRHGRVYDRGATEARHHRAEIQLRHIGRMAPGRYLLRIEGRRHATVIVVR
jgi:hypothetical protein